MADKETASVSCAIKLLPPGRREHRPHQMSLSLITQSFPRPHTAVVTRKLSPGRRRDVWGVRCDLLEIQMLTKEEAGCT